MLTSKFSYGSVSKSKTFFMVYNASETVEGSWEVVEGE